MTEKSVAVLAIGDELLGGYTLERNSAIIADEISALGLEVSELRVLRDNEDHIAETMVELSKANAFVFVTGGLGPTLDDVTRFSAAKAACVELELSEAALDEVREWWKARDTDMPKVNERQALMPVGSVRMTNTAGTAPGFRLALHDSTLIVLPGPPREMLVMLERDVMPWLMEEVTEVDLRTGHFYLFGLSESVFAEQVGEWMNLDANPLIGVTASRGVLTVRMRAMGDSQQDAAERLEEAAALFRERFREHIFSETDSTLEVALARELVAREVTITFAESCTGGKVAASLCRVPGVSSVFTDGFVTYSNDAKVRRLGVSPELLEKHGAVSEEVARAMAEGAALMSGARLAVSITGIVGPDGGSPEKPVGLVWFAVSVDGQTEVSCRHFPKHSRDWIRDAAARMALHLAWTHLPAGPLAPK